MMVAVSNVEVRAWVALAYNDRLRRSVNCPHGLDRCDGCLQRSYNGGTHSIFLQQNQVIGAELGRGAVGANVIDDQTVSHARACHGDDFARCHRASHHRPPESSFNLRLILGLDIVEAATDDRAGKSAHPSADRGARPRMADGIAD